MAVGPPIKHRDANASREATGYQCYHGTSGPVVKHRDATGWVFVKVLLKKWIILRGFKANLVVCGV